MMNHSRSLLIVGDSTTLGITEALRSQVMGTAVPYVGRLRELLPEWTITVDAELHRRTSAALTLLPALLAQHRPDVMLLLMGGTDADLDWRRYLVTNGVQARSNVPVETYQRNLQSIAELTMAAGAVPIFVDLPYCNLMRRAEWFKVHLGRDIDALLSAGGGQAEADRRTQEYIDAAAAVARSAGSPVATWGKRMLELGLLDRHGPDGFHPGAAAHPLIATAVADAIAAITVPAHRVNEAGALFGRAAV